MCETVVYILWWDIAIGKCARIVCFTTKLLKLRVSLPMPQEMWTECNVPAKNSVNQQNLMFFTLTLFGDIWTISFWV